MPSGLPHRRNAALDNFYPRWADNERAMQSRDGRCPVSVIGPVDGEPLIYFGGGYRCLPLAA
jgi:hypothetical protein